MGEEICSAGGIVGGLEKVCASVDDVNGGGETETPFGKGACGWQGLDCFSDGGRRESDRAILAEADGVLGDQNQRGMPVSGFELMLEDGGGAVTILFVQLGGSFCYNWFVFDAEQAVAMSSENLIFNVHEILAGEGDFVVRQDVGIVVDEKVRDEEDIVPLNVVVVDEENLKVERD